MNTRILNKYRVISGQWATSKGDDHGLFFIPYKHYPGKLKVISAPFNHPYKGWQHVSVSRTSRTPTWEEMSYIKGLFWDDRDTVLQFHPKKERYVNIHSFCLHLWKKVGVDHELPPIESV